MRRSNWKLMILIAIAFIAGIAAAGAVALFLPQQYDLYRGLLAFGSLAAVTLVIVFIGVKILGFGRD